MKAEMSAANAWLLDEGTVIWARRKGEEREERGRKEKGGGEKG